MILENDIHALIELLHRTPMTRPEQLWAGRFVDVLWAHSEKTDPPSGEGGSNETEAENTD